MMSAPSTTPCLRCGQTVSVDRLGGLCPRCLSRTSLRVMLAGGSPARPRLGDYELGEELGRGAMGAVYRARHVTLGQAVALKVVLAGEFAGETERRRFLSEAGHAARLDHPSIVRVLNYGEAEGRQFYAMELVEGPTLAQALTDHRAGPAHSAGEDDRASIDRTPKGAATLVGNVARAVQHAHERGVLHRDLKPGNILIDREGRPRVTDFGLARSLAPGSSAGASTLAGSPVGTPAYMAPEQVRGDRDVTVAADVWSLGAMLYELLAGRPPFAAESAVATYRQILEDEPRPLTGMDRRRAEGAGPAPVPRDLGIIALKCLRKDPLQRYASAGALADDLDRWVRGEPIAARPVRLPERLWRWTGRHPLTAGLSMTIVLGLLIGTVLLIRANRELTRALADTRRAEHTALAHLHTALVAQVRARRGVGGTSAHADTLRVVAEAARLDPSPDTRDEAVIALAARDRDAARTDGAPRAVFREFAPPPDTVRQACSLAVSPDGALVAVATHDGLHFWDTRTGGRLASVARPGFPWPTLAFGPDGASVIHSARNFGLQRRPVARAENDDGVTLAVGPAEQLGRGFDSTLQQVVDDGRGWLVALDRDPIYITKVELWRAGEPGSGRVVATGGRMTYPVLSPDTRWMTSTLLPADDVRLWDAETGKVVRDLGLKGALLTAFTPDSRRLVTRDATEYAAWEVGSWRKLASWPADTTSLAARIRFSPDGTLVAVLQGNDRVQFVRTGDWRVAVTLIGPVQLDLVDMGWNGAGDHFYLLNRDGQVREWNLRTLREELAAMGLDWSATEAR